MDLYIQCVDIFLFINFALDHVAVSSCILILWEYLQ